MSKQSELDRLWSEMRKLDYEIVSEGRQCGKNGSKTKRYEKLSEDMRKLKQEYEKVNGGGEYNPMSIEHGERMTTKKVMGTWMGKMGGDSHNKLAD